MQEMGTTSEISENMPNASMMNMMWSAIFGNIGFQQAPSQTGEINYSYGQTSYFSIEGAIYVGQINSAVNPTSILPGSTAGQQNVNGQITVTGAAGNQQVAIGNATQQSGSF